MQALTLWLNRHWPQWYDWVLLTRFNRPIGSYLLIGPTLWALWIAAEGTPKLSVLLIFIAGVFLMRSTGCIINDYADRHWDGEVKRTHDRPLVTGRIQPKQALIGFFVLAGIAFFLVLFTNPLTIGLSFAAVGLAALYPFMKRYTHLPQVFLGMAYSMAIPMAFAAQANELPSIVWLLYIANVFWTIAYDTLYAMVDRDDDLRVGIKSTAVLFGELDLAITSLLYAMCISCLYLVFKQLDLGGFAYAGLAIGSLYVAWLMWSVRSRSRETCFKAFLQNYWFGLIVWAGLVLHYATNAL